MCIHNLWEIWLGQKNSLLENDIILNSMTCVNTLEDHCDSTEEGQWQNGLSGTIMIVHMWRNTLTWEKIDNENSLQKIPKKLWSWKFYKLKNWDNVIYLQYVIMK